MPSWGCDLEDKFTQLCPQPSRGISHLGGRWLPPFADGSSEAHGGEKAACEPRNQGLCSATQSPVPGTPETAGAPVATSGQCWLPTGTCVDETGYSPWFFKATQQPLLGCGGGGGRDREGIHRMGRSGAFVAGHRPPHRHKHAPIFALNFFFFNRETALFGRERY